MNRSFTCLAALSALTLAVQAAVPPAAKLLPKDTLGLVTVPDWSKASADMGGSPGGRIWADPAMKPFRDNFEKKFGEKVVGKMEKDLGIKLSDYLDLVRGQFSIAIIQNSWKGAEGTQPGFLLVIDSKEKSDQLKLKLVEIRKKLADAKKPLKTEKVRDVEFSSLSLDLPEGDPDEEPADKDAAKAKVDGKKMTLLFGQVDTALLVSDSTATLEKVMAGMGGGGVASLSEEPAYQASEAAWFRPAFAYGWIHVTPMFRIIGDKIAADAGESADAMGVDPKAALKAIGLEGLKTISMAWNVNSEGTGGVISLAIPEGQRVGLFKMLAAATKESGPTPFIPADVIKFQRWRIDGQKLWTTLEETLASVSPQLSGFAQMMVAQAGKDKDPSFDLKKSVVANLGDDLITYSKAPKGTALDDLMSPPSLTLVGSPNADMLSGAMKSAVGALGGGTGEESKDREFNGKKIRSIRMPAGPGKKDNRLEMASSAGYMAVGSSPALLEEYLRSAEGSGRSLKDDKAIVDAAQKVGGLATGIFGYENQRETMRAQWEFLRAGNLASMLGAEEGDGGWGDVLDFKALPEYDKMAKYFGIAVFAGSTDSQGMHFRFYGPNPK
jgi:hypothetical protein